MALFFGALGGALYGYDTGVISGAILFMKKNWIERLYRRPRRQFVIGGAILGSGFAGKLTDRFGRRKAIMGAALLFCIGGLGVAFAPNTGVMVLFGLFSDLLSEHLQRSSLYLSELARSINGGAFFAESADDYGRNPFLIS